MFDRFKNSARTVLFRARENAAFEGSNYIEPHHILVALNDLHPQLIAKITGDLPDAEMLQQRLRLTPNLGVSHVKRKRRFSDRSKYALLSATDEGRSCSRHWEVDERHLLLGLLRTPECPMVALFIEQGITLDAARQRLCTTDA